MGQLYLERNMSNLSRVLMKNACADVHPLKKSIENCPFYLVKMQSSGQNV